MGEWTILERLLEAAVQQHSTMIGRLRVGVRHRRQRSTKETQGGEKRSVCKAGRKRVESPVRVRHVRDDEQMMEKRGKKPEREDEGSERQLFTDKQTHGCRLQGVGRRPRAPSAHEMLLRVTARAEQPGHLDAGSFSPSLPIGFICRPKYSFECQKKGR
ncbi:Gap junction delta-2 protein [Takifugu flavidus]|uniref:Gap junction delta-2 protein n=1 Tax=Takifugu flavidus TaxID=433684 RepID=A0A5C6PBI5_9TELE|nr:Gap junction delta-2 protein [Takifugu flavidus]